MTLPRIAFVSGALLVTTAVALAITFGQPDGNLHPNVGGLVGYYGNPPQKILLCTGTLISPTVFLTAAHCTAVVSGPTVWVTFDSQYDPATSPLLSGTAVTNPSYNWTRADAGDIAVVILDQPVKNIVPAQLPALGYLDNLAKSKQLKDAVFVAVGYGARRDRKQQGPLSLYGGDTRYYGYSSFMNLTPPWLFLSQNPSTGDGGTCYGDSGGPNFHAATNVIAAITVTGDFFCRATNQTYRLDTPSARQFLAPYVSLP